MTHKFEVKSNIFFISKHKQTQDLNEQLSEWVRKMLKKDFHFLLLPPPFFSPFFAFFIKQHSTHKRMAKKYWKHNLASLNFSHIIMEKFFFSSSHTNTIPSFCKQKKIIFYVPSVCWEKWNSLSFNFPLFFEIPLRFSCALPLPIVYFKPFLWALSSLAFT